MKKNVLIVLACILALGCENEEAEACNCGLILYDNVSNYSVVIRSNCSGNEKQFNLSEGDWMNAHPGDDYCITNSSGW